MEVKEKGVIDNIKKLIKYTDTAALSIGLETLTVELAFRSKYKHERYYSRSTDYLEAKRSLYLKELERRKGEYDIKARHALEKMEGVRAKIDDIISNQKDIYEKTKKKELFA